ncbi:MAG: YggS family pyridoxal phosphate-dependent enzyme [Bdellovibrionales bacterium]|nr:YggS family pyridoxal phosphate-dependent enzyme [Bdellovibrionales bacterium]
MTPYETVRKKIIDQAAVVGHAEPTLVAVSKTKSLDEILKVYHQGQKIFGENYVQELIEKSNAVRALGIKNLEFHFIGHLQRNKVKLLLPHVTAIHSVDSVKLFEEIEKHSADWNGGIFIQVNIDDEASKGGFRPDEISTFADWVETHQPRTKILGLMCIPDPDKNPTRAFVHLAQLRDEAQGALGTRLSMGMTSDYLTAIEQGSTHLRIGSAIFGGRS